MPVKQKYKAIASGAGKGEGYVSTKTYNTGGKVYDTILRFAVATDLTIEKAIKICYDNVNI